MANQYGAKPIVGKGLVFCVDAIDKHSYSGTGTSLTDVVGNATGTISGATFTNNTFSFDGTNDTVNMGNILHFSATEPWTIHGWCYLDNNDNWQAQAGDRLSTGDSNGWNVYVTDNGDKSQVYIKKDSSNQIRARGSVTVPTTTWFLKTTTYDGSTNASGVKFYHNGVVETTSAVDDTLSSWTAVTGNFYIGSRGGSGDWFKGDQGPLLVYNRELTASEVLQNFNAHRGRFGV